jgi:6-methylsalicylic acid synthase
MGDVVLILGRIQTTEKLIATIYVVSIDAGAANAHQELPFSQVFRVIHASGVPEDNILINTTSDSFARVR